MLNCTDDKLAGLIGSRICHDLISPIGAVTNGLELMELAGLPRGPEADLVNQSAQSAAARIKYYRLAFGDTGPLDAGHTVSGEEISGILRGVFLSDRIAVNWQILDDVFRAEAKAILLMLMCAEAALGSGGQIDVTRQENAFIIEAEGPKLMLQSAPWGMLQGEAAACADTEIAIAPAAVQFAILPEVLRQLGRRLVISSNDAALTMRI
ncbi:MAG: histidine phosphotransferase family protein [Pseudomonadota bacterium]